MIISHAHKYVFVELPLTASTAISRELRLNYEGALHLYKHATYQDFLRHASINEKNYFVFGGIRNPLDKAVSHYYKYKTDHKTAFSSPRRPPLKKILSFIADTSHQRKRYQFIRNRAADFPSYFNAFYRTPYSDWSILSHKRFDSVIRFEHLQQDFADTIAKLGIPLARQLPTQNKTNERRTDFVSYYTPEIIPRAQKVFSPYMRYWEYAFPPEWDKYEDTLENLIYYQALNFPRILYWKYLRNKF